MKSTRQTGTVAIGLSLLCGILFVSCASVPTDRKVTLSELIAKKATIRVRDLAALDLVVEKGHGPVYWATLGNKTEVWFWVKSGVLPVESLYRIVLIVTVPENDENHGTIIWPRDKVGHDYANELKALYPE